MLMSGRKPADAIDASMLLRTPRGYLSGFQSAEASDETMRLNAVTRLEKEG